MKSRLTVAAIFLVTLCRVGGSDDSGPQKVLYANPGDKLDRLVLEFGNPSFTVQDGVLLGASGGGFYSLPVVLKGDFQVDFDVYGDAGDVDSNVLFFDALNGEGIEVNNCPQNTDTPFISIKSGTHLRDHEGFYFELTTLVTAPSTKFPNNAWTHVRITKKGHTLTDNVGGQVISTTIDSDKFPAAATLGLGYYATQNCGGTGQIRYAHIRVRQTPAATLPAGGPEPSSTQPTGPVFPAGQQTIRPDWD